MYSLTHILSFTASLALVARGQYSATYLPSNVPDQSEEGQSGTNTCGTSFNQTGHCQNAYINSVDDWCVWGPPEPGPDSVLGNTERIAVAWCIKNGTGARLIPDGSVTGAHFVETPDFIQVTGVGNFTNINIPVGDAGGEVSWKSRCWSLRKLYLFLPFILMDPHGADGKGNPIGGLVFSNAFGAIQQVHEWTNFMSDRMFCFRACKPGPRARQWCEHIYDVMGCAWNMPANYSPGIFEQCKADSGQPMGIYGSSKFHQGQPATPSPHPAPSSSSCTTVSSIGNGFTISGTVVSIPTTTSTSASGSDSSGPGPASSPGPASGQSQPSATAASSTNAARGQGVLRSSAGALLFGIGSTVLHALL